MLKVPMYTLAWSSATEVYELYETHDRGMLGIVPESPAWFSWLDQVSSFAFVGKSGHYTARKEAKQRGDRYWYAYLVVGEHLTKRYLGKTINLTLARLEQIAGMQDVQSEDQTLPPVSPATGVDGKVEAAQQPMLAQQSTPINPLLTTKLHVPRPRTQLVPRVHLVERLQRGVKGALTLVSAPAGFGKTTLLTQWIAQSELPVAWLSLEPGDNDPTRFLTYLIAALQTLEAELGTTALALLRTPQPASPEAVLAMLTNELVDRGGGDVVLVLDDYHLISAESIQRGMTFLLEHLPPQMHLLLATRADPPLPLARLRAQGQLTEVRAADLRFGPAEMRAFLQAMMGLDISASTIATLERHTEGWIAGLLLPEAQVMSRVGAIVTAAHAYRANGDVTLATERSVAAADALIRATDNPFAGVRSITLLARLYVLQGRLRKAAATYAQVEQLIPRPEILQTFFSSLYYYFSLGDLLREWNELDAAERQLAQGMALVKETLTVEPFVAMLGYTSLARLQQVRGNSREALAILDGLAHLAGQRHFPQHLLTQVAAVRAQLELAQGNLAGAIRWADSSGLSSENEDLPYPREGEYLALARVRIAQAREDPKAQLLQEVLHLLDRLLQDAQAKARMGSVLEILVLRALALEAQGNRTSALSTLERALVLAAPEGYIRLFVDEGAPMLILLRQAYARGIVFDYIAMLLVAFGEQQVPALPPLSPGPDALVEPLTEREREVLLAYRRPETSQPVTLTQKYGWVWI